MNLHATLDAYRRTAYFTARRRAERPPSRADADAAFERVGLDPGTSGRRVGGYRKACARRLSPSRCARRRATYAGRARPAALTRRQNNDFDADAFTFGDDPGDHHGDARFFPRQGRRHLHRHHEMAGWSKGFGSAYPAMRTSSARLPLPLRRTEAPPRSTPSIPAKGSS